MLRKNPLLVLATLLGWVAIAGLPARAAPPVPTIDLARGRVEVVDVAGRRIQIGTTLYGLSSTAALNWRSGQKLSLRELQPGMTVRYRVTTARDGTQVIQQLVLSPD